MRIVYLHQYFNTPTMPGGGRSYELARRLVKLGHDVDMITSWRRGGARSGWFTTIEDGIRVHWLRVPYGNDMKFLQRILAFVRFAFYSAHRASRIRADVVFATSTPLTIALPGIWAARRQSIPFVFEVRDMWPDVPIALGAIRNPLIIRGAMWLERVAYRRASRIIALAPGMRDDIVAKGVPAEKVAVVPNGCSVLVASGLKAERLRAEKPWLGNRSLVLYAGAMGVANGVTWLVRLAERVRAMDGEVRFVLFGNGAEYKAVRQLAADKGLLNHSVFVYPAMPKQELIPWLIASDMHVALMVGPEIYLKDAVNNKFFDALSAGRPIANNFHGWQTCIANDADIGVYLDPENLDLAASSLTGALNNSEWLAGVPQRSAALALGRFNFDHLAKQVAEVLLCAREAHRDE